jgi:hypothetical protein
MAKRLPRPANPYRVRVEWDADNARALDVAAAECGLSVASFARLALEMLTASGRVSLEEVKERAIVLVAGDEPEPEPERPAKKRKGK